LKSIHETPSGTRPIGVFDSGVGGLSVLQALRSELPAEDFVYLADSAHAPYGERDESFIIERSGIITRFLLEHHHIQLLVMACNTATAAAIQVLRGEFPTLPIVGVEPAVKPAVALSQTKHIGVMATRATLNSTKFRALLAPLADQATFICQPCDGLAGAIERQETSKIIALCADYTGAIGHFGPQTGEIDTVVLGCTHYPFAKEVLAKLLGPKVHLVDNGDPVARQAHRLIGANATVQGQGHLTLLATGDAATLQHAAQQWLGVLQLVETVSI
jgi:glutamate racemase